VDIKALAFKSHALILQIFYKEAVLVFVVFCLMFFALACYMAIWAFRQGEFRDLEAAKFEMLED